ncbi:MAG: hypothetical protein HY064_09760 [Bacteroidetes bacterium]|nr:hypothetical protein [Bacteroidota bacterium]
MAKKNIVDTVISGGGHVVILGAGASIASTIKNPEPSGKQLPSMDNFIEVVGLKDIVEKLPPDLRDSNFENLYSKLHAANPKSKEIQEIEFRVSDYFKSMKLPAVPTIYDLLVLSLRSKDLIATFNWDPFLYHAWCRNYNCGDSPQIAFLHGNVAIGYSKELREAGYPGKHPKDSGVYFEPTQLLFPVTNKNYNQDDFTIGQWELTKDFMHSSTTKRLTIFGYGAPSSDVEAIRLMSEAWGDPSKRNMEQVEIIDIRPEEEVRKQWDKFIHPGHYDYGTNFFDSVIAHFPRRTSESWFCHYLPITTEDAFIGSHPIPKEFKTLQEMWNWFKPLIDQEEKFKAESPTK